MTTNLNRNITMKSLFISQLEALGATLEATKPTSFDMGTYYKASESYSCGYAACVCGEQAMSGRLESFPLAKARAGIIQDTTFVSHTAGHIDEDLRAACHIATGDNNLAESVTAVSSACRRGAAAGKLTYEQMQHPHLNSNSSPEHAVSYINMLIRVLTEAAI